MSQRPPPEPSGELVVLDGQPHYRIRSAEALRPFLLMLASGYDHWLYASSNGALTAGRGDADHALFPYSTEDKIHDSAGLTGPRTILRVRRGRTETLWEPFAPHALPDDPVHRALYKNLTGDRLVFEETHATLELVFRYAWETSPTFGFVRTATLLNHGAPASIRLLDGLLNLLPAGVTARFQSEKSVLLDAYKKNELLPDVGLGLFTLSSLPVDRPEPAEALRATTVWSAGLPRRAILLSATQLPRFRAGETVRTETETRGERGAYLIVSGFALGRSTARQWMMVADVARSSAAVADLARELRFPARLSRAVRADVGRGRRELERLTALADAPQCTGQPVTDARHRANVLCNLLRGGVFAAGGRILRDDLRRHLAITNRDLAARHAAWLRRLPETLDVFALHERAAATGDAQLERVCGEFLPLTLSRRHGDPSRPWNRFALPPVPPDGRRPVHYEGNWRDLFQNWEALAISFPAFLPAFISRFLNATTADGYNPYRLAQDGFDWEVPDPHDPWAHIGYWGDHQIVYLHRLLAACEAHFPGLLRDWLARDHFAFACVPYRIKPLAQLLTDPHNTVEFDAARDHELRARVARIGADGRLLTGHNGAVRLVNLAEKLLVPVLAKLANFIPGAGLWLNTQRPEWNDANNALVGRGASVVTMAQLRAHLVFLRDLLAGADSRALPISAEVVRWLRATARVLRQPVPDPLDDACRYRLLLALAKPAAQYRAALYRRGLSGRRVAVRAGTVRDFCADALRWLDDSLARNRREDGLYHAYNLVRFDAGPRLPLRRLPLMLEGQVAALSSGALAPAEAVRLLAALRRSPLYQPREHSYLLYPDRALPRFIEKNVLPRDAARRIPLFRRLLADGDTRLVERDHAGHLHFHGDLRNAAAVAARLDELAAAGYARAVARDRAAVLAEFERCFDHAAFTGRSGAFFGYEGLGCIYWHMPSKLVLAAQENCFAALDANAPEPLLAQLAAVYHDLRAGLGDRKSPAQYGAFPMDPYSHTPGSGGARQPGLTGQVKEDILSRFGEFGVRVRNGEIHFQPHLLRPEHFRATPGVLEYFDAAGQSRRRPVPAGALAFTCCSVPFVYRRGHRPQLVVQLADGTRVTRPELHLDADLSRELFLRTGRVTGLWLEVPVVE
jgi:hypothetical protein